MTFVLVELRICKLIIDPETSTWVKELFDMKVSLGFITFIRWVKVNEAV